MNSTHDRTRRWFGGGHGPRHHHDHPGRPEMDGGRHRGRGRGPGREPFGFDDPRGGFGFGGFGPFGHGPRFGHRPKVGRGDVRSAVLRLLAEEPRNGYQLIQELSDRSGGVWRPSPGSIYPALQQLEDEGLVRAEEREGKRVFALTEAGQTAATALGNETAPWDIASGSVDDETMELRGLIAQVAAAVVQVAQAGNDAQIAKAKEVMVTTRRSLYRILADDDVASGTSA